MCTDALSACFQRTYSLSMYRFAVSLAILQSRLTFRIVSQGFRDLWKLVSHETAIASVALQVWNIKAEVFNIYIIFNIFGCSQLINVWPDQYDYVSFWCRIFCAFNTTIDNQTHISAENIPLWSHKYLTNPFRSVHLNLPSVHQA